MEIIRTASAGKVITDMPPQLVMIGVSEVASRQLDELLHFYLGHYVFKDPSQREKHSEEKLNG